MTKTVYLQRVNTKVEKQFIFLQKTLTDLISDLDRHSQSMLEDSPPKGGWSVSQVMYHLNQAESLSVLYVSKKRLGAASLQRTGIGAWFRLQFARIAFYLPFKLKAPQVLGTMPQHVSYPEIKSRWLKTREEMKKLLESLREDELRKPIFKQPTFGRWNIFQMLRFMQAHMNRHRQQMFRNLESLSGKK